MAKGTTPAGGRLKRLSFKEFGEIYGRAIDEGRALDESNDLGLCTGLMTSRVPVAEFTRPRAMPWERLQDSWLVEQLRASAKANHPDAFKLLLLEFLSGVLVKAPAGVFTPWPKGGKPGRPISSQRAQIYQKWRELGEPSPYGNELAKKIYGSEFTKADPQARRLLRDRTRLALDRALDAEINRLEAEVKRLEKESAAKEKEAARLQTELDIRRNSSSN